MAGEQSGGRPGDGGSAGGEGRALTGGLSGGEWWRTDFGGQSDFGGQPAEDSVYAPETPTAGPPASGPAAPAPQVPVTPPRPSAPPRPVGEPPTRPAVPTAADFAGWDSVVIEFPPDDAEPAPAKPIPDQRAGEPEPEAAEEAGPEQPGRRFMDGRRPSPLLLLAAAVLVGGAVSGLILVLLIGWALTYLSRRLGDLTKKFAVFGIPLIAMTASSLWVWGRAQDRWGSPLAKGDPATRALLTAAPGVLRLAGVLTALFITALAMRRRR
ncbi:hypothetical protein [Kitasatospora viridis]|uniref:Uncharacterized protein n=1 Tax=Kitasatospora viridis TaxID=281105 RepID=A0A561UGE1_9ACTN|nr:hypothetical protein [Kitasatospora viridis]TWF98432.1 hypothetical protein FHX73_112240 [Kitasatospora viridis]